MSFSDPHVPSRDGWQKAMRYLFFEHPQENVFKGKNFEYRVLTKKSLEQESKDDTPLRYVLVATPRYILTRGGFGTIKSAYTYNRYDNNQPGKTVLKHIRRPLSLFVDEAQRKKNRSLMYNYEELYANNELSITTQNTNPLPAGKTREEFLLLPRRGPFNLKDMQCNFPYYAEDEESEALLKKFKEKNERWILAQKLCKKLHDLHTKKIIHRDLKLDNIVVSLGSDGHLEPHIVDYDFAVEGVKEANDNPDITYTSPYCGTAHYSAPELFGQGGQHIYTPATDKFALGILFIRLGLAEMDLNKTYKEDVHKKFYPKRKKLYRREENPVLKQAMTSFVEEAQKKRRQLNDRGRDSIDDKALAQHALLGLIDPDPIKRIDLLSVCEAIGKFTKKSLDAQKPKKTFKPCYLPEKRWLDLDQEFKMARICLRLPEHSKTEKQDEVELEQAKKIFDKELRGIKFKTSIFSCCFFKRCSQEDNPSYSLSRYLFELDSGNLKARQKSRHIRTAYFKLLHCGKRADSAKEELEDFHASLLQKRDRQRINGVDGAEIWRVIEPELKKALDELAGIEPSSSSSDADLREEISSSNKKPTAS